MREDRDVHVVGVDHSRAVLTAVRPDDAADVLHEAAPEDAGGDQQQRVEGGAVEPFAEAGAREIGYNLN